MIANQDYMSVLSSTGQTLLKKDTFARQHNLNHGVEHSIVSDQFSDLKRPQTATNLMQRERKLVEQVDGLLTHKKMDSQGFPQDQNRLRNFYDERSMISVSQEPQSRLIHREQNMGQQNILRDLDQDRSRFYANREYQNADLNDSHMDMSLSVVSDQTRIENKFNSPNQLEEKYGLDLGARKRTKNNRSTLPVTKEYANLNSSVLANLENKTNVQLFKDVSVGYFDNLAMSFRRVLTSMGHNLDEQRQLLLIREKLKTEGDELSLDEVQKIVQKNDLWNLAYFTGALLIIFSIIFKLIL